MNWNQVVSEIGPRLYRYFSVSFPPQVAADLTQETLIRFVKKHAEGAYDPSQGTPLMYAYGIARWVRQETWKSAPPEEHFDPSRDLSHSSEPCYETHPSLSEATQARRLRSAIAELNDIQKQIVLLHIDEELTLEQIAIAVNLPLNTVKSHIHRAKEKLRKRLNLDGAEND